VNSRQSLHNLLTRSPFASDILRSLFPRVSPTESTSAPLRRGWLRRTKPQFEPRQHTATAIQQQILTIHRGPSLIEFVAKTIVYADAKTTYFNALRKAAAELMNVATGREARPPELDTMAEVFAVGGEKQETVADKSLWFY
jgi:hypothetical protein